MAILLFDFDGVLADTLDDLLNFAQKACLQLGLKRYPTPADLDALENMSFTDYGHQLKVPARKIDDFVSLCLEMFNQKPNPPKIFDGMEKVIIETAEQHTLAILTGNTTPTVDAFLNQYGLREHIKLIIGVEYNLPRSEKIRYSLKELGQNTEFAYMIGDSLSDIRAAKETGIQSIAVSWGHQSPARLKSGNPDYQVKRPQDLMQLLKRV